MKIWPLSKPITDRLITPDTKPPKSTRRPAIDIWGAPGQHLPASLVLHSPRDVSRVRISASALRCGRDRIAPEQIDLRVVKCWYMSGLGVWAEPMKSSVNFDVLAEARLGNAGRDSPGVDGAGFIMNREQLVLAPELMLHDDELIDIDRRRIDNVFRFTGMPTDASSLLPFRLRSRETKQLWITVHVPEDAAAGRYEGHLTLRAAGRASIDVPMTVDVLPIALTAPRLQYMMYYDSHLTARWGFISESKYRTPVQMLAELRDLRAHGVENTTVCEWIDGDRPVGHKLNFANLDRVMDLREEAGFPVRKQPLFWSGGPGMLCQLYKHDAWRIDNAMLRHIERVTKALLRWADRRGIPEICHYGVDEVQARKLKGEIRAFKLIHRLGAKIMVAVQPNFHDYMGDLVDYANVQGDPHDPKQVPPRVIRRIHRTGGRIYNYARPQTGECRPHTYRRNYGTDMYTSEMDGPWPYGYQCMSGRYQAYDRIHTTHGRWLNHPFSYPTEDGVIITWGSQGWRAAVDDVRYLTTLQRMVDTGEGTPARRKKAKSFLGALDSDGDLDAQRKRCARHILALGG
ncbi:MAG: hypothetical protein CMJ18_13990 [Phycisphaeraceae bacterium]|nr:hypothetical protein [Phycisphaeraceae bacterium]